MTAETSVNTIEMNRKIYIQSIKFYCTHCDDNRIRLIYMLSQVKIFMRGAISASIYLYNKHRKLFLSYNI